MNDSLRADRYDDPESIEPELVVTEGATMGIDPESLRLSGALSPIPLKPGVRMSMALVCELGGWICEV